MITPTLAPGGAERWAATLIRFAQRVKWVRLYLSQEDSPDDLAQLIPRNVEIVRGWPTKSQQVRDVDILVGWGGDPFAPFNYDVDMDRPTVLVSHSDMLTMSTASSTYYAAVSRNAANLFPAKDRADTVIIHNGIDLERVQPGRSRRDTRINWGLSTDHKILLYVGRFSEEKNPGFMLDMLEQLDPSWALVYYGWGPLRNELIRRAAEHFNHRVVFPQPSLGPLGNIYHACDALVIPSHHECFPLVLLEGLHAGIPVFVNQELPVVTECPELVPTDRQIDTTDAAVATTQIMAWMDAPHNTMDLSPYTATAMVDRWETYLFACVHDWQSTLFNDIVTIPTLDTANASRSTLPRQG